MAAKKAGAPKKGSPRKSIAKKTPEASSIDLAGRRQSETEIEIRRRAYELYEARGREDGFDREDWTQAEVEVLSRLQKKEST
jgi:Protein of unknown function (DUF2934)